MADDLPVVITSAGLQSRSPAEVNASLIEGVTQTNPGYTANLPGLLIEDISSTDVAAILQCDSARVELVNSLSPRTANAFLLLQLGQMLGINLGAPSNTSVFLLFEGTPGFVIGQGFLVSDGNRQYAVQVGGIIGEDGQSDQLFALATQSGTWAVPPGTVTGLITSVPDTIDLTVVNPQAGVPGTGTETQASYRQRVMQGNLAASQGMTRYLRTVLDEIDGVQSRLIAARQRDDGGWTIIVGGGDPYKVAYGIFTALFDISTLVGSELIIAGITQALPAVVTTFLNHGLADNEDINIADTDPSDYDGDYVVTAVPTEKTFKLGKHFLGQALTAQSWAGGELEYTVGANHGVTVGSTFVISGSSPAGYNGTFTAITGTATTTLKAAASNPGASVTLGALQAGVSLFDSSGLPAWVSGGIVTPNHRNVVVSVNDYPDAYSIPYINPPQQVVTMTVTWDTSLPNFVSDAAVAQAAIPALVDFINTTIVSQALNVFGLEHAFHEAVEAILPVQYISVLTFAVAINGVPTSPLPGTFLIEGDPESYFFAEVGGISVVRT